ncbi:Cullin binding-domain-containing protein [Amanita rubescens]|nr:Cullin binding-domain-containing protein [Amanita rubescens]
MADRRTEENVTQFCSITGASPRDARKFLDKYKRLDVAIDAYYGDSGSVTGKEKPQASTSKLNSLFDKYKDPRDDDITIDGTLDLCSDLKVDPEDVALLAMAYELKSPRIGVWTRQGWIQGWKNIGCDTMDGMKVSLGDLRDKLSSSPKYFQSVYNYAFNFAKAEPAQRSLPLDTARAYWTLLISQGSKGKALKAKTEDEDVDMVGAGWQDHYTQWWFDFLNEKGARGVSRDTWVMFLEFIRATDANFENYDMEAAWPSTIDDFVEYAKNRLKQS